MKKASNRGYEITNARFFFLFSSFYASFDRISLKFHNNSESNVTLRVLYYVINSQGFKSYVSAQNKKQNLARDNTA